MKNAENSEIILDNNPNKITVISIEKKFKKFVSKTKYKHFIFNFCAVLSIIIIVIFFFKYSKFSNYDIDNAKDIEIFMKKPLKTANNPDVEESSTNVINDRNYDVTRKRYEVKNEKIYNFLDYKSKNRLKRDNGNIPLQINEIKTDVEGEKGIYEQRKVSERIKMNGCKARFELCRNILKTISSQMTTVSDEVDNLQHMIDILKPNTIDGPSIQELYECLKCDRAEKNDKIKKTDSVSSTGSHRPRKYSGASGRSKNPNNVNHVVNGYTNNDKSIEGFQNVELPKVNHDIERTILVSKSNTSKIQAGTKITEVIRNKTVVEKTSQNAPMRILIPVDSNNLYYGIKYENNNNNQNKFNSYNTQGHYPNRMTTRDTTLYQNAGQQSNRKFGGNQRPLYPVQQNPIPFTNPQMPQAELTQQLSSKIIPTAEHTSSSQQFLWRPMMCIVEPKSCTMFNQPISYSPVDGKSPTSVSFDPASSYSTHPGVYPPIPPFVQFSPSQIYDGRFQDPRMGSSGSDGTFRYNNLPQSYQQCNQPTYQSGPLHNQPSSYFRSSNQDDEYIPQLRGSNNSLDENNHNVSQEHDLQKICKPNYFQCQDESHLCIPIFQRCDGQVDCPDGSDEHDSTCSCKDRIKKDKLCDGYFDCPRGEDELGCFGCRENSFSCQDWTKRYPHGSCVQLSERCDGIKQCPNSKDEVDCSILTQSFIEDQDMFTIGYSSGYLFKNYQGRWYPVCTPTMPWAIESCTAEVGVFGKQSKPIVSVETLATDEQQGSYIAMKPSGQIDIVPDCSNTVIFVKCPPIPCGTRVLSQQRDSFKPYGVYDDTLVASRHDPNKITHATNNSRSTLGIINDIGRSANGRIVGGRASEPQAWPFLVAIYRDGYFQCGGVIINEQWILTAAHCVEEHQSHYYQILAGLLRRFSFSPMGQVRQAKYIIRRHDYNRYKMINDIALIRLNEPLKFNRGVRAACLPKPQWSNKHPSVGEICTTIGWGATVEHGPDPDDLREVEVPIMAKCKHAADNYDGVVCAGFQDGGKDACQGDSGGPLMCELLKSQSQWYVAGVVSHGEGCARPDEPGAYTRVSFYLDWINNTMKLDHMPLGSASLNECPGFKCMGNLGKCLPYHRKCDKNIDCLNAEDENNCEYGNNSFDSNSVTFGQSSDDYYTTYRPDVAISNSTHNPIEKSNRQSAHLSSSSDSIIEINSENHSTTKLSEVITITTEIATEATTEKLLLMTDNISTTIVYPDDDLIRFTCSRLTQTIEMTKRCNKVVDCEDGTDEAECSCKDFLFNLQPSSICDGRIDCADTSDEQDCDFCNNDEFICKQSGICIPKNKRCDKIEDCPLHEDESYCFALTNGSTIDIDYNEYPALKYQGVLAKYSTKNEEWIPVCVEDIYHSDLTNKDALDYYCRYFGFREHATFSLRQVSNLPFIGNSQSRLAIGYISNASTIEANQFYNANSSKLCNGLNIQCELAFNQHIDAFAIQNPYYQNYTYLWPWEGAIFVDGHYYCPAVLLNYNWALTTSKCTKNIDLQTNYTILLSGLSLSYRYADGPYQQINQVNKIINLEQLQASMLRIDSIEEISKYIQPIFFDRRFYPASEYEECVAIATGPKFETKTLFLDPVLQDCPSCHRCFKNKVIQVCGNNNTTEDWSGIVTCHGLNGWYPAAIFYAKDILCGFDIPQSLTSIDYMYAHLMTTMADPVNIPYEAPPCDGRRCSLGNCVSWDRVCDGIQDCRDSMDENATVCNEKKDMCKNSNKMNCQCLQSELKCKNGMCIPKEKYCDGNVDCTDGSDEPVKCDCAGYFELTHPERICDNIRHCYDKSDENHENCLCGDASFKCNDSINSEGEVPCISHDFVCDGEEDCANGEDEKFCRTVKGSLKDPQGTGEVLRRSYGVWHSECFLSSIQTNYEAEKLCQSMDYATGTIMTPDESAKYGPALLPQKDNFYIIRFNNHILMALRDNKPIISLGSASQNCSRAFVKCS